MAREDAMQALVNELRRESDAVPERLPPTADTRVVPYGHESLQEMAGVFVTLAGLVPRLGRGAP